MTNTLRIKRRASTGLAGAPSSLKNGELAFNENDNILYYGYGDDGSGNATSIPSIGGAGGFMTLSTSQTISGAKTFSTSPIIPTPTSTDNSTKAASTAYVQAQFPSISGSTISGITYNSKGLITSTTALVASDIPTLTASKISDFDTQVRTSRLDQMAAPTGSVSWGSQKITSLADPTGAQDAATKNYVDLAIQGQSNKATANYATTGALPSNTYSNGTSGVGATLTGSSNGALASQDGQSISAGDVILVKNEATGSRNGLYTVTQVGTGSLPYILTRHVDMDASAEFGGGIVVVENGTTNAGSLWMCTTNAPTVGTTSITFTEMNKAADLQAGQNISISGNTVAVTFSGISSGSMLKYNGTGLAAATDGSDYLSSSASIDGGTF